MSEKLRDFTVDDRGYFWFNKKEKEKNMNTINIELITWHDSYGVGNTWQPLEEVELQPAVVHSVGYVVAENDICLLIVPHISKHAEKTTKDGCGDMVIPKCCILLRETILGHSSDPSPQCEVEPKNKAVG